LHQCGLTSDGTAVSMKPNEQRGLYKTKDVRLDSKGM